TTARRRARMRLHRNAKLGLAGRQRRDQVQAVGELGGAADALLSVRSLEPAPPLAAAALREPAGADLRRAAPLRARPAPDRRPARLCARDRLEGAPPRRLLAARADAARAGPPLRVALPRRLAAR